MASLDLSSDYEEIQKKISATKTYSELKKQYAEAKKKNGETFEKKKSDVTTRLDDAKKEAKRYQKQIKTQFEELLDLTKLTGGKGNTTKYVKKLLLQSLKNIEPKLFIINEAMF